MFNLKTVNVYLGHQANLGLNEQGFQQAYLFKLIIVLLILQAHAQTHRLDIFEISDSSFSQ